MKLKINFNHFSIDSNNEANLLDRKQWTDSMNTYWTNIIRYAKSISKRISLDVEDNINLNLIKLYMPGNETHLALERLYHYIF